MNEQLKKTLTAVAEGDYDEDDENQYEIVKIDEWTQDGKYQHQSTIIKYQDKFYSVNQSRSGSYHTDYYYNDPDVYEVKSVEVLTKVWKPV